MVKSIIAHATFQGVMSMDSGVEYILVDDWKYCPKCDRDALGIAGRHDNCCWCGSKLEEVQTSKKTGGVDILDKKVNGGDA